MSKFNQTNTKKRRLTSAVILSSIVLALISVTNICHALELKAIDPLTALRTIEDLNTAPRQEKLTVVAPRNGYGSTVLILTKLGDTSTLTISVTDLKCGNESLAKEVIDIRYAVAAAKPELISFKAMGTGSDKNVFKPYYDSLFKSPPEKVDILPVWLTVAVPSDTKPGEYIGKVTAGTKSIDLVIKVSSWICPDPDKWQAHAGILSSPETLAIHYNVKLWSEQHWKLVEQELEFLAGLGNDDLWVSALPYNHFGQQIPWITFSKQDQNIVPNLKLFERYLDLYSKHVGQPKFLLVEVWNSQRYGRGRRGMKKSTNVIVDGEPQSVPLPGFDGADKVWAPLMNDLNALIKKKGWPEEVITLGCADDIRPSSAVTTFFAKHAPYAKWAIWTHGRGDPPPWKGSLKLSGMTVSHYEHLFCPHTGGVREDGIVGGWDLAFPEYGTARNLLPKYIAPTQYRQLPEGMTVNIKRASQKMSRSSSGVTRLCLDFWRVRIPGDPSERDASLLLAYEKTPWEIFYRNNTRSIIEPGPDGPVGTVRYEMLREGMQECEARIQIEKALQANKLKGTKAKKARKLLAERLRIRENNGSFLGGHAGDVLGGKDHLWGIAPDWQQSAERLFSIAASLSD